MKICRQISTNVVKNWSPGQTITLSFIGGSLGDRVRVRDVGEQWLKNVRYKFKWVNNQGMVRISFIEESGSWSLLGRADIKDGPTMNFSWIDDVIILHLFGHMLGLTHSRPPLNYQLNEEMVMKVYGQYWDKETIHKNVIDADNASKISTVMDCYFPKELLIGSDEDIVPSLMIPRSTEPKIHLINSWIRGTAPTTVDFIAPADGHYYVKIEPKARNNAFIDKTNSGAAYCRRGLHTIKVTGRGNFKVVIRQI